MSHLYVPIFGSSVIIGLLALRQRTTGRTAWMCLGTGIANGFVKVGCLIEAAFMAVEIAFQKFGEVYRANKAAQGL